MTLENPWWQKAQQVPKHFRDLKHRAYLEPFYRLLASSKVRRAIVLMGPRRVGKTVMLHHAIHRLIADGAVPGLICYVSLDHPLYNGLRLDEIVDHFIALTKWNPRKQPAFVFFDEIQYLRDWEKHLKVLVDEFPRLKCVASGSAAAALRLKSAESGAGRFTEFLLPPLTFHEYLDLLGKLSLVQETSSGGNEVEFSAPNISALNSSFLHYLNFGGYPEVIFSEQIQADPHRFIKSDIIDKVLLRDLPSLYGITDINELNYLFTTLAFNTAGEVSLSELSQNSGVAKNTIKRYIEYLEAAFLIRVVHRIDRSGKRFKRASHFKVYLTNPSLRAALFAPAEDADEAIPRLAETAVFAQWFHSDMPLHYARWEGGEVDVVRMSLRKPDWAVEVKWSDRPIDDHSRIAPLISFCRQHKMNEALVTTKEAEASSVIDQVHIKFVPTSLYCFTVGHNLVRGGAMLRAYPGP
jgi:predicted AAA+ superfamily ATPase